MTTTAALDATGVAVDFGGVRALAGIDITVAAGSVVGLIGPNGAGKTTLLAVLSGLLRSHAGRVFIDGRDVTRASAQRRAQAGLARTFQQPELFPGLTVRDHLVLAHRVKHERARLVGDAYTGGALRRPSADEREAVASLLERLDIAEFADRDVVELPLGVSRLVEVGRALATEPRVLLLDEPCSGLDRHESRRLAEALANVTRDRRVALVLVEHDVEIVFELAEHVYVLDFGSCIAAGGPADIRADPAVQVAFLGDTRARVAARPAAAAAPPTPTPPTVLSAENITVHYGPAQALAGVSFELREGSAVAVLGANGAGKSSLARALSGLIPLSGGRVLYQGTDVTGWPAHRIRRRGLVHLPEGRGIFSTLTVAENLRMAVAALERGERGAAVERAIEAFPILGNRSRQIAGSLSGGEQQMLSLARVFAVAPRVVIADELSLGLAPRVVDMVFEALATAVRAGTAIVLIEQFVERALEVASTCVILQRGSVCWSGRAASAGAEVLDHYLGTQAALDPI